MGRVEKTIQTNTKEAQPSRGDEVDSPRSDNPHPDDPQQRQMILEEDNSFKDSLEEELKDMAQEIEQEKIHQEKQRSREKGMHLASYKKIVTRQKHTNVFYAFQKRQARRCKDSIQKMKNKKEDAERRCEIAEEKLSRQTSQCLEYSFSLHGLEKDKTQLLEKNLCLQVQMEQLKTTKKQSKQEYDEIFRKLAYYMQKGEEYEKKYLNSNDKYGKENAKCLILEKKVLQYEEAQQLRLKEAEREEQIELELDENSISLYQLFQ